VQKPHCSAWWRLKASCRSVHRAIGVSTGPRPSRWLARRPARPASCTPGRSDAVDRTVQAPHTPCSQPTCVPVAPSSSRRKSVSSMRGCAWPLRAAVEGELDGLLVRSRHRDGHFESHRGVVFKVRFVMACSNGAAAQRPHELTPQLRAGLRFITGLQGPGEIVQGVFQGVAAQHRQVARRWAGQRRHPRQSARLPASTTAATAHTAKSPCRIENSSKP
jgi:hypothetical protein